MSERILTLIITHENIGEALFTGVTSILGPQRDVHILSNKKETLPVLVSKVQKIVSSAPAKRPVCFTDLKGGSCWTLANMVQRTNPHMVIISGVNLPMLVTYFNNISHLGFNDLIDKTVTDGTRGICQQGVA